MAVPPAGRVRGELTPDNARFYGDHGYLYVEQAVRPSLRAGLHDDAVRLCRGDYGSLRMGWGLAEGQEGLRTGAGLSDDEALQQVLAVHFPHKLAPAYREAMTDPCIVDVLTGVIGPNVKCMQSMLFIKSAGKPGQAWHQDESFIPTRDRSLTAAWVALDDATTRNGCLWALPGSHRRGILWPHVDTSDPRFDCSSESTGFPWTDDDAVPLEVAAGDAIVFNGYLLHRSLPNDADAGYRRAAVFHYMSAESLLPWDVPERPKLIASHDVRDIVMVAGEDPYSWAPVEDVHSAHLRPSGAGGCGKAEYNRAQPREGAGVAATS